MSGKLKIQDLSQIIEEPNTKQNKEIIKSVTKLTNFNSGQIKPQISIHPRVVEAIRKQFNQDLNAGVIKKLPFGQQNIDGSSKKSEVGETDNNQHTIKLRFLMDKHKVKDFINQKYIKQLQYLILQDKLESFRQQRNALINWSADNLYSLNSKDKDNKTQYYEQDKLQERKNNDDEDSNILNFSPINNNEKRMSIQQNKIEQKPKSNELNFLTERNQSEMWKKESKKEEQVRKLKDKYRLNKRFDFNSKRNKSYDNYNYFTQQDRYQDGIFAKLPNDIDSIHKNLVEYIDYSGQGNLQPQNLVELKNDIYSALGMNYSYDNQNLDVLKTKAIYSDYLETFSTVGESSDKKDFSIFEFQRQISPISRQVIKQDEFIKVDNPEEADQIKNNVKDINLEDIQGEDLLNIISGRVGVDELLKYVENHYNIETEQIQKNDFEKQNEEETKEQIQDRLNEIRSDFLKKGTVDKDIQTCILNKNQKKLILEKQKQDLDLEIASASSHITKSQKSIDTLNKNSNRVSIISLNNKKQKSSANTPLKRSLQSPKRKTLSELQGTQPLILSQFSQKTPRNKAQRTPINNRSSQGSLQYLQFIQTQQQDTIKDPLQKKENDDLSSVYSLESEFSQQQQQKDLDEKSINYADQKYLSNEEYLNTMKELDEEETEHNQLLKLILSSQLCPKVLLIYEEVKKMRELKKVIMNSKDINEAVLITRALSQQICSKMKEILLLVFEGETNFEIGLARLLQNIKRINQKENTIEQGKLKLVFALLQQFRIALQENKMDKSEIEKQKDPEYKIQVIQEVLDNYNQKKKNKNQSKKEVQKIIDFSKLSYHNFKQKNKNSIEQNDNDGQKEMKEHQQQQSITSTTTEKTIKNNINQSTILSKSKQSLKQRSISYQDDKSKIVEVSFSKENTKTNLNSKAKAKIGLNNVSSQASLNTAANTHKNSISTVKTNSFYKDKSTTSLNKSPSGLSQLLSLSPLTVQQDSPFLGNQLQKMPELYLNLTHQSSISNQQELQIVRQLTQQNQSNNLWNQAKLNIIDKLNIKKEIPSTGKKKNVTFTWQQQVQLLKEQKEQDQQMYNQSSQVNKLKIEKLKNVINNYEQIIHNGSSSFRNKSNSSSRNIRQQSIDYQNQSIQSSKKQVDKIQNINSPIKRLNVQKFSPVNSQKKQQYETPKNKKILNAPFNKNSHEQEYSNESQGIFQYMKKENSKSHNQKNRKNIYSRAQNSFERVQDHFNNYKVKTQEFQA